MTAVAWNGAVCQTCCKPYLNSHSCAPADLLERAKVLIDLANRPEPTSTVVKVNVDGAAITRSLATYKRSRGL